MNILTAIEQTKTNKPSQYSEEMMLKWLSELDGMVYEEVLERYGAPEPFLPYTRNMLDEELAIPFPYDGIYLIWLSAQINSMNCEYERYNNDMMAFNARMEEFQNWYTRKHKVAKPTIIKGARAL